MRIRHDKPLFPWRIRKLERNGILRAHNIFISPKRSRVCLKVVVFKDKDSLMKWFARYGGSPHKDTGGMVNYCSSVHHDFRQNGKEIITRRVEPRFFAVMGLIAGHIDLETIAHECVHAAEAYSERFPHLKWPQQKHCEIEKICYPAGILTQYLFTTLAEFIKPPKGWLRNP